MPSQAYQCKQCNARFFQGSEQDSKRDNPEITCLSCGSTKVEPMGIGAKELAMLLNAIQMFRAPLQPVGGG